jgi:phosphomannomutase
MNRVLVAQAAAGLAAYLLENKARPSVVIGFDGRKNSAVFAKDTAEIMAGAGIRAVLLPRLLPTPVLAFAVRYLDASAGVMVTASHNPANDNGYKVYLGDDDEGSQIVPPADENIAAHILRVAESSIVDLKRSSDYEIAAESVIDAYVNASSSLAGLPAVPLTVVYTALHGVGWQTASRVFKAAGFAQPILVDAQIDPDPSFPTVAFPNPEEPGALDLSFATAREADAELIIANDPDADRLAVAIPDAESADGYRRLSGNEVGSLLGWQAAEQANASADADSKPTGTLACSIVSSPSLKAVAEAYGLDFAETLTGFKWVSRAPGLIFGFEEALGYLVNPDAVRDKDGISAAVAFLRLAASLKSEGLTVADQLSRFSERFGHFASDQISLRVTDLSEIDAVMARLRERPPAEIGGIPVSEVDDLIEGFADLPPSDVLRFLLEDGSRVMIRPSGTEPKLKVYLDASSDEGSAAERRATAEARLAELRVGVGVLLANGE